jgi:hypothetical protein
MAKPAAADRVSRRVGSQRLPDIVYRRVPDGPGACPCQSGFWWCSSILRTNLTTRALAALFNTIQSTLDRVLHLVPVRARALQPDPEGHTPACGSIDATPIPVHDQSITALSKNYRRSTQIVVHADKRRVITAGTVWPGNRNDVVVAPNTVTHLFDGSRIILGNGGYRGIGSITTPPPDKSGRIIRDHH